MRDVAFVPESDIFKTCLSISANDASQPAELFTGDGVALVRHSRRTFLPFGEWFLRFAHFGALQVTNFERDLLYGSRDNGERGKIFGVAVTLNHLRRNRREMQTKSGADALFNFRVEVRERADRAR